MCDFLDQVEGMDYGFNLKKLFGAMTINKKIGMGEGGKEPPKVKKDEEEEKQEKHASYKSLGSRRTTEEGNGKETAKKNAKGSTSGKGGGMGGIAGVGTLLNFSNKKESYFCSELIAAALKAMGLMFERRNELFFWPGEFGEGGALEKSLIEDAGYGAEILIDCRQMEIGNARVSMQGNEKDGEEEDGDD